MPASASRLPVGLVLACIATAAVMMTAPNGWSCAAFLVVAAITVVCAFWPTHVPAGGEVAPQPEPAKAPVPANIQVLELAAAQPGSIVAAPDPGLKPPAVPADAPRGRPKLDPVFPESVEFFDLHPVRDSVERKQIAHRLDRSIRRGERMLTERQASDSDVSPWELDRIGLYVWEAFTASWPDERTVHVQYEFDLLERADTSVSLMPLYYALESWESSLRQRNTPISRKESELIQSIYDFASQRKSKRVTGLLESIRDHAQRQKINAREPASVPDNRAMAARQSAERSPDLGDYGKKRAQCYQEATASCAVKLRIGQMDTLAVVNDFGDAIFRERYERISSYEENPIESIDIELDPESGFVPENPRFDDCKPPDQTVEWKVTGHKEGRTLAQVSFVPAVSSSSEVSFTRHWRLFNATYFNQRDRSDAGANPIECESISHKVRYAYDLLILRIQFPERYFPSSDDFHCSAESERPDPVETEWLAPHHSLFPKDRVAQLVVPQPLPGYTYKISWRLPDTDAAEKELSPEESNMAEELSKRIGSLAAGPSSPYRNSAIDALESLAASIARRFGNDLRLTLYAYIHAGAKGGLIPVLDRQDRFTDKTLITIGRTLVGRCFRRKSFLVYQSIREPHEPPGFYEPLPSEKGLPLPAVAIAGPLLYPIREGRRMAVLYIATRTPDTRLIEVFSENTARRELGLTVERWYVNEFSVALKIGRLSPAVAPKR